MKERRSYIDLIWWLVLIAWSLTILFPIVWVLYESLKTNPEFFQNVWTLPDHPQWMNYKKAWLNYNLLTAMLNTLYYVGASLVIGTFLTALNAYALTRIEFKGRKFIWGMIMLSLFLPGINALIPQYILMRDLHLTNSLTGLILLNCLGESVFSSCCWAGSCGRCRASWRRAGRSTARRYLKCSSASSCRSPCRGSSR